MADSGKVWGFMQYSISETSHRVTADFRVMGEKLIPQVVSAALRLDPDESHSRGDPRIDRGRRYADYSEGLWLIHSDALEEASVETHLENLLGKLSGRGAAIEAQWPPS
jgi:Domain of unknown function (DUF4279)